MLRNMDDWLSAAPRSCSGSAASWEGAGPAQELGNGFIPAGLCCQEGFCELQGGCNRLTWGLGCELPLEKCNAGKSPPAKGAGFSSEGHEQLCWVRSRGMRDAGTPAAGFSARDLNLAPSSGEGKLPLWGFPLGQLHPGHGAQREM